MDIEKQIKIRKDLLLRTYRLKSKIIKNKSTSNETKEACEEETKGDSPFNDLRIH